MHFSIASVENAQETVRVLALIIVLAPLAAATLGLLLKRRMGLLNWVTPICSGISLLATLLVIPQVLDRGLKIPVMPFLDLYLDALSLYFVLLVNLVAFFASFSIAQFLKSGARGNLMHNPGGFILFFNLFQMTMLLAPMVENLVTLWMAVELTTVFSAILVGYKRDRLSLEAAWKFMMINTTGIIFALLGTLFMANAIPEKVFGYQPMVDWMNWSFLANWDIATHLNKNYVMLSFLFILLGYGTKAGLAPMHSWLPDSHGEAPSPVSALLSGVMLKTALYAILRFATITNLCLFEGSSKFTSNLLLATGVLSLILATPFIVKRNPFKRTLAFHSLEHIGIIAIGIGIGTPVAVFGALLHTLNHALTKALMFLVYGSIQQAYQERGGEAQPIQGVLKAMPLSGTILAFGGLALAGSPPFSIFMSEFVILWAALREVMARNSPLLGLALACVVVSIGIIFGGLVGHLARLLLGPAPFAPVKLTPQRLRGLAPFLILLAGIVLFGFLLPRLPVDLPLLLQRSVWIVENGVTQAKFTGVP